MATGNLFGIGVSALTAFRQGLAVTSHNIANVNTAGYSRERLDLVNREPMYSGSLQIGVGSMAKNVQRVHDVFIQSQILGYSSGGGMHEAYYNLAHQLDQYLSDGDVSLNSRLQGFFDSVQGVTNNPSSVPARQAMLSEANALADRFNTLQGRMDQMRQSINKDLGSAADELSSLSASIADINKKIVASGYGYGAQPPNDLLDQRDELVRRVSELAGVSTTEQNDGALNVFIGNGQALVLGAQSFKLSAVASAADPADRDIAYITGSNTVVITDFLTGGKTGGLLKFRDELLDSAQNDLGRLAAGMATTFNAQHAQGMDLDGNINRDLFTAPGPVALANSNNTSAATAAITITDASQLRASSYELEFDGTNYRLTDAADGSNVATFPAATPFPYAVAGHGFSVTVTGAPNASDRFALYTVKNAAGDIDVAVTSARQIAAAAPIRSRVDIGNGGTAAISAGSVTDSSNALLQDTVRIQFSSIAPDRYDVFDVTSATLLAANVPYTSGNAIQYNGWSVEISGTPMLGDMFYVENNAGGVGDNRNALLLAGLQNSRLLDQGSSSYQELYGATVANVGASTSLAKSNSSAQNTLLKSSEEARAASSGVNLDEEAANLMRYQQAYQAAAQVIATANVVIEALMGAFRR